MQRLYGKKYKSRFPEKGAAFFVFEADQLRCRNKFGMTLRVSDCHDHKVIPNLFQDLFPHLQISVSLMSVT
jgi:hypothetical protein